MGIERVKGNMNQKQLSVNGLSIKIDSEKDVSIAPLPTETTKTRIQKRKTKQNRIMNNWIQQLLVQNWDCLKNAIF